MGRLWVSPLLPMKRYLMTALLALACGDPPDVAPERQRAQAERVHAPIVQIDSAFKPAEAEAIMRALDDWRQYCDVPDRVRLTDEPYGEWSVRLTDEPHPDNVEATGWVTDRYAFAVYRVELDKDAQAVDATPLEFLQGIAAHELWHWFAPGVDHPAEGVGVSRTGGFYSATVTDVDLATIDDMACLGY